MNNRILIFNAGNDIDIGKISTMLKREGNKVALKKGKEINDEIIKSLEIDNYNSKDISVLIHHAGTSGQVSHKQLILNIKRLLNFYPYMNTYIYLSGGRDERVEGKELGLKIIDTPTNFKTEINKLKESHSTCFEALIAYCKKKVNGISVSFPIQHFLPLDVYIQALKDAKSPKVFLENMYEDLDALYRLKKYDSKNINHHYRQKLYDLWYLLGQDKLLTEISENASSKVRKLTPMDNPSEELLKIAGINNKAPKASQVYKFFESLDNARKMDGKDLTKTIKNLSNPFDIQIKGEKKKITTFHDWYCALAKCLRNENKS